MFAMASVGIMIEGQEGLTWERWRRLCHDVETLGFASLRRSDHFFSVMGEVERECIECWTSLALAAEWTKTIEFGPMVSPMTFRAPALLARIAASVDQLSGGRLILGVGAGWYEREHVEFGIPFLTMTGRMDLMDQGIATVRETWAKSNPKPVRSTVPLLMGGRGEKRTLPTVAREAAEWNLQDLDRDIYVHKKQVLEGLCKEIGRDPSTIRHSVMAGYLIGRTRDELRERANKMREIVPRLKDLTPDAVLDALSGRWFVGTPDEIVQKMRDFNKLGMDLFMLQHFLLDDQDALKLLATDVLPAVR